MRTVRTSATANGKKATDKKSEVKTAEGMYRVYIAADKNLISRVTYNYLGATEKVSGKGFDLEEEGTMRINVLDLLLDTFDKIKANVDLDTLTSPIVINVPDSVNQNISCENYKYWIMTGTFINGTEVDPEELEMWKEFHEARKFFDLKLIIRNMSTAGKTNYKHLSGVAYVDGMCVSEAWDRVKTSNCKIVEEE